MLEMLMETNSSQILIINIKEKIITKNNEVNR